MQFRIRKRTLLISLATIFLFACSAIVGLLIGNAGKQTEPSPTEVASTQTPTLETSPTEIPAGTISTNLVDGLSVVYIPQGSFTMGSNTNYNLRKGFCLTPQHKVTLDAYWMDQTEVTVAAFRKFVQDTSYTTDAEKNGNAG